ncbi:MAG: YbaK/EbsC family protein [Gemmatimonadetes bacterium]|uniref:YbaK/EbsC family protein n=1 Tax=Candidatus Kutchimonas denitrificans TaxID=3056748 RepID=A0AAE4Z8N8_9BACT|nr:YbaK/EbsC family protein [Gemmatimonadota bacterium]NIR74211.1 YbaK/EbsC family protein [Candidatus Kutchimonas denitrificans]NIR99833.1 YbaK/EbsC family protein [Gemmatimonadota bacterium]NIT65422.1 YbaK/EbsC family protein [Gemmatimonadota bacterium]NIU51787.1 deacylase [Gemmatimonadota bacterium]
MSLAPEVEDFLKKEGIDYEVIKHPTAYTAAEEAAVTHISGYEWAKTVIFFTEEDEPIMAVLPASYHVKTELLEDLVGSGELRLAEESEFAGLFPSCEPGAMPPLGNLYGQRVFVDQRLAEDEEIVFNAGNHREAVRIAYSDFERAVEPVVGDFGEGP